MSAFYDTTCTKCKKRFGWAGELKNKPACPKCKHKDEITQADLDDEKEIDNFRKLLKKRSK